MKPLLALPSIALLALSINACGDKSEGSGTQRTLRSAVAGGTTRGAIEPAGSYVRGDGDGEESRADRRDEDDRTTRGYGRAANQADKQAASTLVKRYYEMAAAGNGRGVCSLLYPNLANSTDLGEQAETAYQPAPTVPPLHGKSCTEIMTPLLAEDQRQLAFDGATVKVTAVRVNGDRGLAILGFKTKPERQLPVRRARGAWKVDAVLDKEIP